MRKIMFSILSFLFLFPLTVSAASCNKTQISRYKQLANQIQTTFEYNETDEGLTFDILFHNVYKDLEIVDYYTYDYLVTYNGDGSGIVIAPKYEPGKTYKFSILNNGKLCDIEIIKELKVVTPNYNKYYKDPLCDGISSFELCQKWSNIGNISYETFKNSVMEYKANNKENDTVEPDVVIEDNFVNKLRNFFGNYYLYIILGLLAIISIIMFLVNNKRKNDW